MFRDTLCYKHFHFQKHIPMYMGVCIIHHLAGADDGESQMRYKNEEKIT